MLTPRQRQYLKALAHPLKASVHVGKAGVTQALGEELDVMLDSLELIKIKVNANAHEDLARAQAQLLARVAGLEVVRTLGRTRCWSTGPAAPIPPATRFRRGKLLTSNDLGSGPQGGGRLVPPGGPPSREVGVPFLSWFEGDVLHRYALTGDCQVGRDPVACPVSRPHDPSVSRVHAQVVRRDGRWCVQDQASLNGVIIDGLRLAPGELTALLEGQEIRLGDWILVFTEGFPGLDGVNFLEGVGDLFSEQPTPGGFPPVPGGPAAAAPHHRVPAGGGQRQCHVPAHPHRVPGPAGGGPGLRGDGRPRAAAGAACTASATWRTARACPIRWWTTCWSSAPASSATRP